MSAFGFARNLRLNRRTGLLALAALATFVALVFVIAIIGRIVDSDDTADAKGLAEREIAELTNAVRNSHGLPSLETNEALTKSARGFAEYLAGGGEFDHEDADGNGPEERAAQAGYGDFTAVVENLASGDGEADAWTVMTSWLESQPHRENLIHADATDLGVACAASASSAYVCVLEIGARTASP